MSSSSSFSSTLGLSIGLGTGIPALVVCCAVCCIHYQRRTQWHQRNQQARTTTTAGYTTNYQQYPYNARGTQPQSYPYNTPGTQPQSYTYNITPLPYSTPQQAPYQPQVTVASEGPFHPPNAELSGVPPPSYGDIVHYPTPSYSGEPEQTPSTAPPAITEPLPELPDTAADLPAYTHTTVAADLPAYTHTTVGLQDTVGLPAYHTAAVEPHSDEPAGGDTATQPVPGGGVYPGGSEAINTTIS